MDDGALPLGHAVKAWEDTKTFMTQDHPGYGGADPHVWFLDTGAAERAGFSPAS
ncbi:sunset domain-containing protein [Nostocoides sp.]